MAWIPQVELLKRTHLVQDHDKGRSFSLWSGDEIDKWTTCKKNKDAFKSSVVEFFIYTLHSVPLNHRLQLSPPLPCVGLCARRAPPSWTLSSLPSTHTPRILTFGEIMGIESCQRVSGCNIQNVDHLPGIIPHWTGQFICGQIVNCKNATRKLYKREQNCPVKYTFWKNGNRWLYLLRTWCCSYKTT